MSLVPRYCPRCGQSAHDGLICAPRNERIDITKLPELMPLPMILHCPVCSFQHVDAPDPEIGWTNPPHKSHLCLSCKCIWRPCDIATEGVKEIGTRGKADTWPRVPEKAAAEDPASRAGEWSGACVCPFGTLLGDCPVHGYLVPP